MGSKTLASGLFLCLLWIAHSWTKYTSKLLQLTWGVMAIQACLVSGPTWNGHSTACRNNCCWLLCWCIERQKNRVFSLLVNPTVIVGPLLLDWPGIRGHVWWEILQLHGRYCNCMAFWNSWERFRSRNWTAEESPWRHQGRQKMVFQDVWVFVS